LPAGGFGVRFDIMLDRIGNNIVKCRTQVTALAMASMLTLTAGAAWPQTASPPASAPSSAPSSLGVQAPVQQAVPDRPAPQGEPAQAPPAPPREESPGLLNEVGKLFEKSLSILPPLKTPGEAIDDLNARAKDAARGATDSLSNIARPSSMVAGRMICPVAANGAPDCKAGADKLCRSKGYKEGKSLTTDSAETCSARVLIPGRARKPGDCRTDNYVTSALCQ
jgi:uncharacterized membrane protein